MQQPTIQPGRPFPLGVTLGPDGANVAVFSAHAERIELCLLDQAGERETARLPLPEVHGRRVPRLRPRLWSRARSTGFARIRPLGAGARAALQPAPAAARPLRQGSDRQLRLGRARIWSIADDPLAFDPRDSVGAGAQGRDAAAGSAGGRRAAGHALGAHDPLRGARARPDQAASRVARARCAAPISASPSRPCSTIWSGSASPRSS